MDGVNANHVHILECVLIQPYALSSRPSYQYIDADTFSKNKSSTKNCITPAMAFGAVATKATRALHYIHEKKNHTTSFRAKCLLKMRSKYSQTTSIFATSSSDGLAGEFTARLRPLPRTERMRETE